MAPQQGQTYFRELFFLLEPFKPVILGRTRENQISQGFEQIQGLPGSRLFCASRTYRLSPLSGRGLQRFPETSCCGIDRNGKCPEHHPEGSEGEPFHEARFHRFLQRAGSDIQRKG